MCLPAGVFYSCRYNFIMHSFLKYLPVFLIFSCSVWEYEDPSLPNDNHPPDTYLSLIASDTIYAIIDEIISSVDSTSGIEIADTIWHYELGELSSDSSIILDTLPHAFTTITTSMQELHWWGEDTDGEVIGYKYRWNTDTAWTETTNESAVFFVPITKTFDVFQFEVAAMDNDGNIDQSPSQLVLPIRNSFPEISFKHLSNPFSNDLPEPKSTHITFPTRTFIWDVTDLDGIETVISIFYALDDTCETCWTEMDAVAYSSITLTNLMPGEHIFYLKARDIAGAYSATIQFPDETIENSPISWIVKEPQGSILIVDDYPQDTPNNALNWYINLIDSLEISGFSYWEIGEKLPFTVTDVTSTLNYFEDVIWYAGYTGNYTYHEAETSIQSFVETGGNFFLNVTIFPDTTDISWFPIMETIHLNSGGDIHSDKILIPQSAEEDTLVIGSPISVEVKGFESSAPGYQSLYRLQLPEGIYDLWNGSPTICGSYQNTIIANSGTAVLMSLPLFKGYTPVLDLEWELSAQNISNVLYAVTYSDDGTFWVVGEDGMILRSLNSGIDWEILPSPTTKDLRDIQFINPNTGWIVGKTGTILKTTDGGNTWDEQISSTTRTLYAVDALDENDIWIVGKSGIILHTIDGGETWIEIDDDLGTIYFYDIHFVDHLTGWCVGAQGTILSTEDGGESWTLINSTSIPSNTSFQGVHFNQSNTGWICGSNGTIIRTTDGGENWDVFETGIEETLYDIFFLNEDLGYAVGSDGRVITTFDGGDKWDSIYSGVGGKLWSVTMVNSEKGMIVGENILIRSSQRGNSGAFFDFILNDIFNE